MEETVEGARLLLEDDDDRAHVDVRCTMHHSRFRLPHVLRALWQAEHARVDRIVQVAAAQLQQHGLAMHEGAGRLQLLRDGRQGHVLFVRRTRGFPLLYKHALAHHKQCLWVTSAVRRHIGVAPYPHEQVIACLFVQNGTILQLVQLHRAIYASSSNSTRTLSIEHHEWHVHHLQPFDCEWLRVVTILLGQLLHYAHPLLFSIIMKITCINLEFCALMNMYT